jgi:hypothetical protein
LPSFEQMCLQPLSLGASAALHPLLWLLEKQQMHRCEDVLLSTLQNLATPITGQILLIHDTRWLQMGQASKYHQHNLATCQSFPSTQMGGAFIGRTIIYNKRGI